MGLFGAVAGGLLGGGVGAFSNNPWQGWGNFGSWAMEGLPGALAGAALGGSVGYAAEEMFTEQEMPKPTKPASAPVGRGQSLLDYDDPAEAPSVREAASRTRAAVGAMRGRGATLLTGPSGLKPDDDKPGLLKKTLGGA